MKHDVYAHTDGQEYLQVPSDNSCAPSNLPRCAFRPNDEMGCRELRDGVPPCSWRSVIFVKETDWLLFRVTGRES